MTKKQKSPSLSLEGWDIKEFVKGNAKAIKEILKFVVPFIVARIVTTYPGADYAAGVIGKGLLDIAEFYLKEISLKSK